MKHTSHSGLLGPLTELEQVNLALDAAGLGTWVLDLENDTSSARSLRHDQIFGYATAQAEWGQSVAERHVLAEDVGIFRAAFEMALYTGLLSFQVRVRWPDKTIHWISATGRTYHDNEGKPVRMAGIVADITAEKLTEKRLAERDDDLRQAEERQKFLLRLSDAIRPLADPIQVQEEACRLLGEHLGVNRVFYNTLDTQGRAVIGTQYVRGVGKLSGAVPLSSFGKALLTRYRSGETVVRDDVTNDPEITAEECAAHLNVEVASYVVVPLVKGGEAISRFGVHRKEPHAWSANEVALIEEVAERLWSAVERSMAENALRLSEERFRHVFKNAGLGIALASTDGHFQDCNPAFCAIVGYSAEELAGMHYTRLIHPDDVEENVLQAQQLRSNRVPSIGLENRYLRKDGTTVWVTKVISKLNSDDPDAPQNLVVVADVTARHNAEMVLLEEGRRKSEFIATLSHELRGPLAIMSNALYSLNLLTHGTQPEAQGKCLATMERSLKLLVRLVDDSLDMSRIDQGKFRIQSGEFDLAAAIREIADAKMALNGAAARIITVRTDGCPLVVSGDRQRLWQVFSNLINNALRYTPEGGHIDVSAEGEGAWAVIRVRDDGIGISSDMLPRIFDMFTQAHEPGMRPSDGLGIGLALVRGLVELHGGTVSAASDGLGKGSEFTVRLPVK